MNQPLKTRKCVIPLVLAVAIGALAAVGAETGATYRAAIEKWRAQRVNNLKADGGWLTVAGLFWLHDGENRFGSDPLNDIVLPARSSPADAGSFIFYNGKVVVHASPGVPITVQGKRVDAATLRPDSDDAFDEKVDEIALGDLRLYVHSSGPRYAIRLIDKNSPLIKKFTGLRWFPIDPSYRVVAQYTPFDKPKTVQVQNIMGDFVPTPMLGTVSFTLHGQALRLNVESNAPDPGFSITFRDLTSGKETYGAARFLETDPPKDGKVVLDFNKAHNPPCAYNPYTTCPLPTPENRLRVRVAAGEMTYLGAH